MVACPLRFHFWSIPERYHRLRHTGGRWREGAVTVQFIRVDSLLLIFMTGVGAGDTRLEEV